MPELRGVLQHPELHARYATELPTNRSSSKSVKCNQPRVKDTSTGNSDLINSV